MLTLAEGGIDIFEKLTPEIGSWIVFVGVSLETWGISLVYKQVNRLAKSFAWENWGLKEIIHGALQ